MAIIETNTGEDSGAAPKAQPTPEPTPRPTLADWQAAAQRRR